MRVRSVLITAVAGAALFAGTASAAHATPKGPGGLGNTPTTQAPKPNDKLAPKPTPTTQPKGPGDIVQKPNGGDPKPCCDDLAPAPKEDPKPQDGPKDKAPVPPKGGGDVEPGPDTTGNGSGSDKDYMPPADTDGSQVDGSGAGTAVDTAVESASVDATADATHQTAAHNDRSNVSTFMIIFFALLVAALIGFVATRFRSEDEDVERV